MDKNTILAFILIAIILLFYPYLVPVRETPGTFEEEKILTETVETASPTEDIPLITQTQMTVPEEKETENQVLSMPDESEIFVETDLYRAVFSTKDGAIKSWQVKNYKSRSDPEKNLQLIKDSTYNLSTEIRFADGTELKGVVYEADRENIFLTGSEESADLVLTLRDSNGQVLVEKTYSFYSDRYSFDLTVDTTPIHSQLDRTGAVFIHWKDGIRFTEVSDNGKNLNREDYYRRTYVMQNGRVNSFKDKDSSETITGEIMWGATRSKYFEVFIASQEQKISYFRNHPATSPVEEHYTSMGFTVGFDRDSGPINTAMIYFGPMDYQIFRSYGMGFENTMNWGWDIIKPFSLAIYWTLRFLNNYISNYGLVIIILSLLVNTLVLPFTLKSFKSQAAMKKVQPEMKLIKEKYKNDMQKQQQATLELYKKHGVNPLGTCLPTLLPMPILYGMFIVFGATIEFRNANFIFWINDLSLPEIFFTLPFQIPLYGANVGLMPIIMGLTMYLQMKETASGDPNQKMMLYFMPVFLTVLFNNLSSGLILYYTVGNFYRIVQQRMMKKN